VLLVGLNTIYSQFIARNVDGVKNLPLLHDFPNDAVGKQLKLRV
jgi:hypothetical protein